MRATKTGVLTAERIGIAKAPQTKGLLGVKCLGSSRIPEVESPAPRDEREDRRAGDGAFREGVRSGVLHPQDECSYKRARMDALLPAPFLPSQHRRTPQP